LETDLPFGVNFNKIRTKTTLPRPLPDFRWEKKVDLNGKYINLNIMPSTQKCCHGNSQTTLTPVKTLDYVP
jgi:hypothetical protein